MGQLVMGSVLFAAPYAYVPNFYEGTVSKIDLGTNCLATLGGVATLAPLYVGMHPLGVAVAADVNLPRFGGHLS